MSEPRAVMASVCVPCYNGRDVAWMLLESYCRQWSVGFDWEMIFCEEPHAGMIGMEALRPYLPRLKEVGCRKVTYIELEGWVNLPEKWKIMGQHLDSNAGVFIKQDVDCYTPYNRLQHAFEKVVVDGYDWADTRVGYFYNFLDGRVMLYHKPWGGPHLHIAFKSSFAPRLVSWDRNKGVDSFLRRTLTDLKGGDLRIHTNGDPMPGGVETDGFNVISRQRNKQYAQPTKPCFISSDKTVYDLGLPEEVARRMLEMTKQPVV